MAEVQGVKGALREVIEALPQQITVMGDRITLAQKELALVSEQSKN